MANSVKDSYKDGACPDCQEEIPDSVLDGDSCSNCGHVFWDEDDDLYVEEDWGEEWDDSMDDDILYV